MSVHLVIGLLFAVAAATTTPPASVVETTIARAAERTAIYLHTDAPDTVGTAYVVSLRKALAASRSYRPVADPAAARFVVGIVTMDPNEADVGARGERTTVAAVTLQRQTGTALNQFVYSWVLVARPQTVDSLANELVAAIDSQVKDLEGTRVRVSGDRRATE